jgi:hypothetical protein
MHVHPQDLREQTGEAHDALDPEGWVETLVDLARGSRVRD